MSFGVGALFIPDNTASLVEESVVEDLARVSCSAIDGAFSIEVCDSTGVARHWRRVRRLHATNAGAKHDLAGQHSANRRRATGTYDAKTTSESIDSAGERRPLLDIRRRRRHTVCRACRDCCAPRCRSPQALFLRRGRGRRWWGRQWERCILYRTRSDTADRGLARRIAHPSLPTAAHLLHQHAALTPIPLAFLLISISCMNNILLLRMPTVPARRRYELSASA